jgi:surface antigen
MYIKQQVIHILTTVFGQLESNKYFYIIWRNIMKKFIIAAVLAFAVSGCASTGEQNGTMGGAVAGAALGALIGNAVDCHGCALIFGALGAAAGGAIGNNIGKKMDQADAQRTQNAINTLPTGSSTGWQNPDTGMQYDVMPVKTYVNTTSGDYCREVIIGSSTIGGTREEVYGTACRQSDGAWKMQ